MFDSNFNIIYGDAKTGRTTFLLELSSILKSNGLKIFFLGCTGEFENARKNSDLNQFDDIRTTSTNDDFNNLKLIQVIKEITESKNYDYIMVDDIDYISSNCVKLLETISVKKIITCLDDTRSKFTNICAFYNIEDIKDMTILKDYTTSLIRDKKINSILK